MQSKKGFTIIELIVVIAIIAVLAAVVMTSMIQYITRAKDSSIKGDLITLRTKAYTFLKSNDNYSGFSDSAISESISKSGGQLILSFSAESDKYCASSHLISDSLKFWCVDSIGLSGEGSCASGSCTIVGGGSDGDDGGTVTLGGECTSDNDCVSGLGCGSGECGGVNASCSVHSDCVGGSYCTNPDNQGRHCSINLVADYGPWCFANDECYSGWCSGNRCIRGDFGDPCSDNSECLNGYYCSGSYMCVQCISNEDCSVDQYCDTDYGECVMNP